MINCIFTSPFAVLHPYYKLAYIKVLWGGPEEQAVEIAEGNPYTKDWQDEAKQIVEHMVSHSFADKECNNTLLKMRIFSILHTKPNNTI
jgi:hypothetical protein